jgi:glyoxylase-like metal-dependent hydrolase (beta-lactamase superfamily II)
MYDAHDKKRLQHEDSGTGPLFTVGVRPEGMNVVNLTADAERFTCNAYLVTGDRPALVDAGTVPGVAEAVADRVDRLDSVVLTHQDADHIERLDDVLDAFEPDLYAHGDHPRRTHALSDGDVVVLGDEPFEAVRTPGHAGDHVAFVSDTRLFSGDVVVYNDGAFDDGSFGRTDGPSRSRERLIESLERLLTRLPDSVASMYPGHGDAFHARTDGDGVADVVRRALSRAERREPKYD